MRSAGISFSLYNQHWRHQDYLTEETPLLGTLLSVNLASVALFLFPGIVTHWSFASCWCCVCVGVGADRAWNRSSCVMLHQRLLLSPALAGLQGRAVLTTNLSPSEMGMHPWAALGLPRKPAKLHGMNAIWKNLFTVMCSYSWKDLAAFSSRPSCKCKGASWNAFQTLKWGALLWLIFTCNVSSLKWPQFTRHQQGIRFVNATAAVAYSSSPHHGQQPALNTLGVTLTLTNSNNKSCPGYHLRDCCAQDSQFEAGRAVTQ